MVLGKINILLLTSIFLVSSLVLPILAYTNTVEAQSSGSGGIPSDPTTLISDSELDELKLRIQQGEQPQKSSYDSLLKKANGFLGYTARSVTSNGGGNELRAGQQDTADYTNARSMSEAIYNLSLAYRLSGDDKYAKKALDLINHWSLDNKTYMNPDMSVTPVTARLRVYITIPGIVYGADLIWGYSGWSQDQREEFTSWTRTLGNSAITTPVDNFKHKDGTIGSKNNKESWRQVMVAVAGGFLKDQTMLDNAFQSFRDGLPSDVGAPGSKYPGIMIKERTRTVPKGGLFYSNYGLTAMAMVAEVAWQHGEDLYNYTSNKVSLRYAADTNVKFALNPSSWPYNTTKGVDNTTFSWYEYIYKRTGDANYKKVIDKYKRPLSIGYGAIGTVSATHARDSNDASTPNSPSSGQPTEKVVSTDDGSDEMVTGASADQDEIVSTAGTPVLGTTPRRDACEPLSQSVKTTFGTASFDIDVPQAGRFTVWSRIWAPDNAVNSYWMNINNGYEETCKVIVADNGSLIPAQEWTWVDWYRDPSATAPKEKPFIVEFPEAGTYSFEVAGREGPLRLDRVILLFDDCIPEGTGDNCAADGDIEPPILNTNVSEGAVLSGTFPVEVEVEDESKLSEVSLSVDGEEVAMQEGDSGTFSFDLDTKAIDDGQRQLSIEAVDEDNNSSNISALVTVANDVETAPDDTVIGGGDSPENNNPDAGPNEDPAEEPEAEQPTGPAPTPPPTATNITSNLNCGNESSHICTTFNNASDLGAVFRTPQPSNGWSGENGVVSIVSPANQGSGNANLLISKRWVSQDQIIEVDAKVDDGDNRWQDFSVVFNYRNDDNYYFASFNTENDDSTHGIFKVVNGKVTQIQDFGSTIEQGRVYSIRIERQGNSSIIVYRDGVVVGSVNDSSIKNGHIGLGSRNNVVVFDNLNVKRETVTASNNEESAVINAPSQVNGLFQAKSGKNRIKLRWSASSDSDGSVTLYRVYRSINGGSFSALGSTNDRVYYDLTIKENTTYRYYITAIDNDSNESTPSATLQIVKGSFSYVPPPSPSLFTNQLAFNSVLALMRKEGVE